MIQAEKAHHFRSLHRKGDPVVLYNIWDAGGAKALSKAGAQAIATGSWSVAAAHGFGDGEAIPLDFALQIVDRITQTVSLPVTVDFEGGYAVAPAEIGANVRRVIQAGAIGINFEDRIVGGEGLHPIDVQTDRIKAIREAADHAEVPLFINARTDLFLGTDPATHEGAVSEALTRAGAYAEAGADGFFIPGLTEVPLIRQIVETVAVPVNVMMMGKFTSLSTVKEIGVSRVSYGPGPYAKAMSDLAEQFKALG